MITVGITQRQLPDSSTGENRVGLDERWSLLLWDLGILAIPLPNIPQIALAMANELNLDGIILTGGGDLSKYGGDSPDRDETERLLLAWSIESQKPLLGVCRGMELIADAMGCSLVEVDGHVRTTNRISGPLMSGEVTCYHEWAVGDLTESLVGLAWAGPVLEAIGTPDGRVLGVMWHPEREWPDNPATTQLIGNHFGGLR